MSGADTFAHDEGALAHGGGTLVSGGDTFARGEGALAHGGGTLVSGADTLVRGEGAFVQVGGTVVGGDGMLAALREVRRHGPGALRLGALEVLVHLGGEAALEGRDVAAAERLIRVRGGIDPLQAVMSCWTSWWCVPGGDRAAIVAALGLEHERPVTYRLACDLIDQLEHDQDPLGDGLVYVGPEVNGWTPIIGRSCNAFGPDRAEARATVERLSKQFGEAHAFYFGAPGDGSGWLVARDGATVRRFSSLDPGDAFGEPLPVELGPAAEYLEANDVAAAISLDVGWRLPVGAVVRGFPVIAALPGTPRIALPPGTFEI